MNANDNNINDILENNEFVVVKVGASWCGPCKTIDPIFKEIIQESLIKNIIICTIDADESPNFIKEKLIKNVPTILFIKNNNIIDKHVGIINKRDLLNKISQLQNII